MFDLIRQNADKITKEMIRQLEIEQRQFQKDLATYYGWVNQSQILLGVILHEINKKWQSWKKTPHFDKISYFLCFNRWSI